MSRSLNRSVLVASLLLGAQHASALNIVITNDDGFETPNIQALYDALVAAGHDVILSAPYSGQSGTSGMIAFLRPIGPTSQASPGGTLPAGSPGVGPTTLGPQQFYVDGSPSAAVLYGIDVAAMHAWGAYPDLVISGPNEGNNLGIVTPHSGTIGAAVTALNKRIPAIALSAASGDARQARIVAELTVRLVDALDGRHGVKLPEGIGLNVNTPVIDADNTTAEDYSFFVTRIGESANFGLQFYEHLGDSPVAVGFGVPAGLPLPGVSLEIPASLGGYPEDDDPRSETNALDEGYVTVSPIQGTYTATSSATAQVHRAVDGVLDNRDFRHDKRHYNAH
ncbi:MAG: 5'/3'-nucleotidase SurE [Gammaproteobacteria bacterium]|nr:5'/3'-nucleotidase SurE [Gammaproteobacteria bacterium]